MCSSDLEGTKETTMTDLLRLRLYDVDQLKGLLAKVPAFELVAVYDFWFEISEKTKLTKNSCDVVLILKKK